MLALIQRVTSASVTVDGDTLGAIGPGLLALVGVEPGDGDVQVERMTQRLLGYRVFADDQGRMNRSLADSGRGLLLVSQFTLAADTPSGIRPGFSRSEEHTSELQSLMRLSYAVFCLRKKTK